MVRYISYFYTTNFTIIMTYQNLLIEQKGRIQIITINRESKLNALNQETLAELNQALTAAFDNDAIGGLIITGAGPKAFVAGADIAEFKDFDVDAAHDLSKGNHERV